MPNANETVLQIDGLLLRPMWLTPAAEIYQAARASRPEIGRWMEWCHENYQQHETEAFLAVAAQQWEQGVMFGFAVHDAATNRFLGSVGLNAFHPQHPFANLGYWIRTDATGQGVASRATRAVAAWALYHLNLERLEIVVAAGNIASQRVAEKAGAKREGLLRKRLAINGGAEDAFIFSFVAEDF
jgi:RimJ/RimL family protein N-acetyltransferase